MYQIGDFSQLGQVSVRMLRHYDKLGLLKPGHVDQWTSYRYYTLDQLPRLHRILALKDLGLSLGQIGQILDDPLADQQLHEMLAERKQAMERQLADEQARLERVSARLQLIEQVETPNPYEVVLKSLPEQLLIALRRVVPHVNQMDVYRDRMLRVLYKKLDLYGISPGTELAIYHLEGYSDTNIDMSLAVEVDEGTHIPENSSPVQNIQLPGAPLAASIVYHGSMWNIPDVVINLYRWIGKNGYTSAGDYREIHLFGRELDLFAGENPDDAVFEILVPVSKR
jgi:DNA-binding transcriptional MerR regulator